MKTEDTQPDEQQPVLYSTRSSRIENLRSNSTQYRDRLSAKLPAVKKVPYVGTALIVLACLVAGLGGGYLGGDIYNHQNGPGHTSTAAKQQYISDESALIAQIAKDVGQSVVSVDVQSQSTAQDFFGFSQVENQQSAGTGFIISSDGIIVTNRHVVPSGTTNVSVTLADGTKFNDVSVIGRTNASSPQDIAFLKINNLKGKRLVPVTLGDSSKIQVGDRVVAIGNALGQYQNTVTSGIISGYGRDVTAGDASGTQGSETLTDLFQTDAAINEGNSGGPLVDINGEVIGINTATASDAQNIGFAQPIDDLKGLINSVLSGGKLEQPYLGVRYVSLTDDIAYEYNLSVKRGAYVVSGTGDPAVVPGSPADKAGVQEKDVITKINNVSINETTSLTAAISRFKVGDHVTLTIVRAGKTITKQVTLAAAPTD
ncbi:MAG TPA: trypsin-like peptidase domain-containing protein [Candidatus Saccharimonadales bacterium]|nr:trypsin-like peptidase domain-containing protein [Candidatus Saccharimonadales bacterium]